MLGSYGFTTVTSAFLNNLDQTNAKRNKRVNVMLAFCYVYSLYEEIYDVRGWIKFNEADERTIENLTDFMSTYQKFSGIRVTTLLQLKQLIEMAGGLHELPKYGSNLTAWRLLKREEPKLRSELLAEVGSLS